MNAKAFELAVRKHKLIIESDRLRKDFTASLENVAPLFSVVDRLRDSGNWLKQNVPLLIAIAAGLLVARPRRSFRWLRRGFFAWQAWRKLYRNGVQKLLYAAQVIRR